jgi:exodeoxyribonuclease-3
MMSIYAPNGRAVDSDHYHYKLAWFERLKNHLAATCTPEQPVAVCGDFNVAPTDADVFDPAKASGGTHVTPPERDALAELEGWGLTDAFRTVWDVPNVYSWWDYRAGDFHEGRGMRIDLVLMSAPLVSRVQWAVVDRNARKGKQPSDHAPVVIDLAD